MTPNSETDDAEIDIKSEEKDSPKGSERSTKSSSKSAAKRRTKTGCLSMYTVPVSATRALTFAPLACRKRRIKCGEEKPVSCHHLCQGRA